MANVYRSKVKVGGAWKTISAMYVKVDGTWKLLSQGYVKINGVWRLFYPYPLNQDTTLATFKVNGTSVPNGGTYNVSSTTTSVTLSATTTSSTATISGAISGVASASGSVSVSRAGNPNTKTITVTAEDTAYTANYSVNIQVAAASTSSVTIYYRYCQGIGVIGGSYTDTSTSSATTACNNRKAALGNPTNWTCQGSEFLTVPPANYCSGSCTACCQDTGEFTCGPVYNSTGGVVPGKLKYTYYQSDPCCNTSCPPRIVYVDGSTCLA